MVLSNGPGVGGRGTYAAVAGSTVLGIEGLKVTVEVDVSTGLPGLEIAGMGDTAVRESRHRVRSAIKNSGFDLPSRKVTVNLAPAAFHKEGSQLDLPIALGILAASGALPLSLSLADYCFLGELSLDGTIRPVRGVLAMALSARDAGCVGAIIPKDNGGEVSFLTGMDVRCAGTLGEVVGFLSGGTELEVPKPQQARVGQGVSLIGLEEVHGQRGAKRALEVGAAGGHNLLMVGGPGAGKSMLARCIPGILPGLSSEESLEVTRIASVAGVLPQGSGPLEKRPFRAPHHSVSLAALVGGMAPPVPGEITLAHRGVLFLDELPEFPSSLLNALRGPLEDGFAVISRSKATCTFPCRFMLVGAANPCPCGFFGDETHQCVCTEHARLQYASRLSGPFLDRIDLYLQVPKVKAHDLTKVGKDSSDEVRQRVTAARERQSHRLNGTGLTCNAEMGPREVTTMLSVSGHARRLLMQAYSAMGLSARGYYRVLKVAASVADLCASPRIEDDHVAEALSYRQTSGKEA